MPEHSPSPWQVQMHGEYVRVIDANGDLVSDLRKATAQGLANAYLKAAAPELLDSLDLLLCLISVNGSDVGILSDPYTIKTIHEARTVVAKATGEKLT